MKKIKINDEVVVLSGRDRGKTGKIEKIFRKKNRVIVKGVNMIKKNIRPTQENPNGGIVDKEASIHYSNVALISPKTNKATRIRIEVDENKKNARIAVKCGSKL